MADPFSVSRRNAAMLIAGTLAASARSAAGATSFQADIDFPANVSERGSFADVHRDIARLLQSVRRTTPGASRGKAFERCKSAFRVHDVSEASIATLEGIDGHGAIRDTSTLYRYTDPSTILVNVIVRELDAWPNTDAGWLERFGDLESAFETHVMEQERAEPHEQRLKRHLADRFTTRSRGGSTNPAAVDTAG